MRDFIPSLTYKYEPAKYLAVSQEHRERTLANKREMDNQRWSLISRGRDSGSYPKPDRTFQPSGTRQASSSRTSPTAR
jgi:hypothetical protein